MAVEMKYTALDARNDLYDVNEADVETFISGLEIQIKDAVNEGETELTFTIVDDREEFLMTKACPAIERAGYKIRDNDPVTRIYKNAPNQYTWNINWRV